MEDPGDTGEGGGGLGAGEGTGDIGAGTLVAHQGHAGATPVTSPRPKGVTEATGREGTRGHPPSVPVHPVPGVPHSRGLPFPTPAPAALAVALPECSQFAPSAPSQSFQRSQHLASVLPVHSLVPLDAPQSHPEHPVHSQFTPSSLPVPPVLPVHSQFTPSSPQCPLPALPVLPVHSLVPLDAPSPAQCSQFTPSSPPLPPPRAPVHSLVPLD
ncbi:unnamed protein product, partial [Coccothraustes coccothraustes]